MSNYKNCSFEEAQEKEKRDYRISTKEQKNDSITVFCERCKIPVGNISVYDIALNCKEVCIPCYDYLTDSTFRYEGLLK